MFNGYYSSLFQAILITTVYLQNSDWFFCSRANKTHLFPDSWHDASSQGWSCYEGQKCISFWPPLLLNELVCVCLCSETNTWTLCQGQYILLQHTSQHVPYKAVSGVTLEARRVQHLCLSPSLKGSQHHSTVTANCELSLVWMCSVFRPCSLRVSLFWTSLDLLCWGGERRQDPQCACCTVLILCFADISDANISQAPTAPLQLSVQRAFSALLKWLSVLAANTEWWWLEQAQNIWAPTQHWKPGCACLGWDSSYAPLTK